MGKTSKRMMWFAVAVVLVAGLVYAYPYRLYYLRDDSSGIMLWKTDQAYFFMKIARRGYHMSYAEYPWALLSERFGALPAPNDQRVFLVVINVSSSGTERHLGWVQNDTPGFPRSFTPVGQSVYTFCDGVLCKWAGDHFENATQKEQQDIGGAERLVSDGDVSVNGWTKREVNGDFSVTIGGQTVVKLAKTQHRGTPTIELDQPGKPAQELWNDNGDPHRVSWWTYKRSFSGDDLK